MTKNEIYDFLREKGISYEVTEHKAVYNMEELADVELPHPEADAKNLFVRDDKKRNYYLITVKGNKRVDLKEFRRENGTRPLTFASESELADILALEAGSVTPLGVLNDEERKVSVFIDDELCESGLVGVHPCENTATVWLKTDDLFRIIKEHGNPVFAVKIK